MGEQLIGVVDHWFGNIGVAAFEVKGGEIAVGDTIHFAGSTTDFTQTVGSIQIEHDSVEKAGSGDQIGIKVDERVRVGDSVYRVS